MKKKPLKIVYKKLETPEELEEKRQALLALATGTFILFYVYKTFYKKN